MAFGVTTTGFVIKRLEDILTEQRSRAVGIFQDLVGPNDVVDTSDSSTIGRLINLDSVGDAQLWELGQAVYSAFDPNTATGIPLDNLVAYGGVTRLAEARSTALGLFSGSNGTLIPDSSYISDLITGNRFLTVGSVALNNYNASAITITVVAVNSFTYTINYSTTSSTVNTITYTSDSSATVAEVLAGLASNILTAHPTVTSVVDGTSLVITKTDPFQVSTFTPSDNITITKVSKVGNLQADVVGVISQQANTLTNIQTPVLGWDSVTNPLAAAEGRIRESDEELRVRFRNTKYLRSSNILDSLYSALFSVDTVEDVRVYENDTDTPLALSGSYNLAPHSFMPVVTGGSLPDIAEAIWRNKPLGIGSVGNTPVIILDSQGFQHTIHFEIPNPVTIYVDIDLTVDGTVYPATGNEDIQNAIIKYAADNFNVGDDVITSRLYTPINSVLGHQVNHLYIGTSPSPVSGANIPIDFNAIASFESVNINITT